MKTEKIKNRTTSPTSDLSKPRPDLSPVLDLNLQLLGLSKKEEKVLRVLQDGADTPLAISLITKVSRPAVYAILTNLKKRGIIESRIHEGRKFWKLLERRELEQKFFETKRSLLKLSEGMQEVFGVDDATVIIHRGQESIREVFSELLVEHKQERFYALAGDAAAENWNNVFSLMETNNFNRVLKRNNIIAETIIENGWLEREAKRLGISWARDFEGRTTRVNLVDAGYFAHGAQVFIFKQSIYLMALGEELVIEIRNSEIQKMLLAFFRFMQDNSRSIDANALLRKLIASKEVVDKM